LYDDALETLGRLRLNSATILAGVMPHAAGKSDTLAAHALVALGRIGCEADAATQNKLRAAIMAQRQHRGPKRHLGVVRALGYVAQGDPAALLYLVGELQDEDPGVVSATRAAWKQLVQATG
jgi:hypothetical protein